MNEKKKPNYQNAVKEARDALLFHFGIEENIKIPVPLEKVIQENKLKLVYADFSSVPKPATGALSRKDNKIFINNVDTIPRQLFTAAHELGHFILHKDIEDDVLYRSTNPFQVKDPKEQEANAFAAELLMPANQVIKYWDKYNDLDTMCELFRVSKQAMQFRLSFLGLSE